MLAREARGAEGDRLILKATAEIGARLKKGQPANAVLDGEGIAIPKQRMLA